MASQGPADLAAGWVKHRRFSELIYVSSGGYAVFTLIYGLLLGQWRIGLALAAPAVFLWLLFPILRSGMPAMRVRLLCHAVVLANMGLLCLALMWMGMPASSSVWWLVWWPMFVAHLLGVLDGMVWMLVALACAGVIWANQSKGWIAPLMPAGANPLPLMQLGFLLVGGGIAVVIRRAFDHFEREILAKQRVIHGQNQALAQRALELEAMLQAVQQSSLARTQLFAQISHEIRTPLNGILGFAQLLKRTEMSPTQLAHMAHINECGHTMLQIVGDVLDLSRLEARSQQLNLQPFDPVKVAREAVDMLSSIAEQKGVVLVREFPAEAIDAVGDALRVKQVMLNLLGNALKFTPGGEVAVRCKAMQRDDGQPVWHVEVQDSGIGISQDALGQLFQPFSQASEDTARQFGGSGLGLAICKRLVDMMNGTIGVVSQPGRGSLFWFQVPVHPQA